jgi:glycosyltransferase involved in cell wall biosynthesis
MKVLFLPFNIASMQAITAEALNNIDGVQAKSISCKANKYNSVNDSVIYIPEYSFKKSSPVLSLIKYLKYRKEMKKWIKWADVLHYVWGPAFTNASDVKFAVALNKAIFIEWVGSDIRNPEILSGINRYYRKILNEGYEYRDIELSDHKQRVQKLFSNAGAIPTLSPEMSLYLNKELFPTYINYPHRINVRDYKPIYPAIDIKRPHIVHSPSVKIGKGSNVIIEIINDLRNNYDFDFTLVHNMAREDALKTMQEADIFIDQIIVGGYGMASCEAMAFGKPVVNFILPEVFAAGLPDECPVVNSNPDNLKEQLLKLINDPVLRNEIGKKGRSFVEKYNDVDMIAKDFIEVYQSAIKNKKPCT